MIVVYGEPVGKGRPRVSSRSGTVYTPKKTAVYENALGWAAKRSNTRVGGAPAVAVIRAYSAPPSSWSGKKKREAVEGRLQKVTKPDIDNIIKSALDGVQGIAFDDDRQIVACIAVKAYSEEPRLEIELLSLDVDAGMVVAAGEERVVTARTLNEVLAKLAGGTDGARLADCEEARKLVEGVRAEEGGVSVGATAVHGA